MSHLCPSTCEKWCSCLIPYYSALFVDGKFAVHRSAKTAFLQVPVDKTIEQTTNSYSKKKGGIVGTSLNRRAEEPFRAVS